MVERNTCNTLLTSSGYCTNNAWPAAKAKVLTCQVKASNARSLSVKVKRQVILSKEKSMASLLLVGEAFADSGVSSNFQQEIISLF